MTLTYDGTLGLGVTIPVNTLHVVGTSTVTSNAFVGNNLSVKGNTTIEGNITVDGSYLGFKRTASQKSSTQKH